jgi:hypothetical protein
MSSASRCVIFVKVCVADNSLVRRTLRYAIANLVLLAVNHRLAVPALSYRILRGNQKHDGPFTINMQGLGIGNGWVDPYVQYAAYPAFAYVYLGSMYSLIYFKHVANTMTSSMKLSTRPLRPQ